MICREFNNSADFCNSIENQTETEEYNRSEDFTIENMWKEAFDDNDRPIVGNYHNDTLTYHWNIQDWDWADRLLRDQVACRAHRPHRPVVLPRVLEWFPWQAALSSAIYTLLSITPISTISHQRRHLCDYHFSGRSSFTSAWLELSLEAWWIFSTESSLRSGTGEDSRV